MLAISPTRVPRETEHRIEALLEAIRLAPAARRLAEDFHRAWSHFTDPATPKWQAALVLLGLIQGIAALPLEVPTAIALRVLVIKAFLESRDKPGELARKS